MLGLASRPSFDGMSCPEDSVWKCRQRAPGSKEAHSRKASLESSLLIVAAYCLNLPEVGINNNNPSILTGVKVSLGLAVFLVP